jgi:hypothetical protein
MDAEVIVHWLGALALAAIVVGVPVSCTVHSNNLTAQAIRDGADPIAADCAFSTGGSGSSTACALAAARLQQAQVGKEKP